jgi:hypothetical protein
MAEESVHPEGTQPPKPLRSPGQAGAGEAEQPRPERARDESVHPEGAQLAAAHPDGARQVRELQIQVARLSAAAKHRLPADLVEFITAEDEAGAMSQAEKLAAIGEAPKGYPAPALREGTGRLQEIGKAPSGYPAPGEGQALTLPPSGGRNPVNGGEQAARLDEERRFDALRGRVPALGNRILRS